MIPWPPAVLSPNARPHFREHATAKKKALEDAFAATKSAIPRDHMWRMTGTPSGPLSVRMVFHPPHKRGYDADNLLARMKAPLDGIALALGVDDKVFRLESPTIGDQWAKSPVVMVEIRKAGAA